MIDEDEKCGAYFDAELRLQEYLESQREKHQEWKSEVQKQARFALTSIESGVSPSELPKKSLDCLVYVLGDTANKAWMEKDYSEALSLLNQVLLYRPDDHMALIMLGDVHHDLGEHKEAAGYYALALDSPNLPEDSRAMVLSHLGISYAQLGDFGRAEESLEKARGMAPEDGIVLNNLGIFYLMRSRYPEALDVLRQAEPLMEEDFGESWKTAATLGNLAMAYFELGDRKNALHYINAALQIDPESEKLVHNRDIMSGAFEGALLLLI
jgi:tetratricopeptide (TPR) repeat protein